MPEVKQCGSLENIKPGYFGWKRNETEIDYDGGFRVNWERCRDRVQVVSTDKILTYGLWFCHKKDTGPTIKLFFKILEKKLKIKKPRSSFLNTDKPEHCLWMNVSPWWLENVVRRSFLTLALRSAQNYKPKKDNFLESFEKNKYGKNTMPAIKSFLEGFTRYRGKNLTMTQGWSRLFSAKKEDQYKLLMFKRKSKQDVKQDVAIWY